MAKWHITSNGRKTQKRAVPWRLVSFRGPNGGEARGVVDIVAIRKNHKLDDGAVRRGDYLDIVLIQTKGGGAARPTVEDAVRMRAVMRRHRARRAVYAHWRPGNGVTWYRLARAGARDPWPKLEDWRTIFK